MCGSENLAHLMVANGWAKAKPPQGNNASRTADAEELARLEAQAQSQGLGMWSTKPGAAAESVRTIINPSDYDAKEILDACKGIPQTFIVEQFRDGATARGYMMPSMRWITVFMSGISCPGFKRAEVQGAPDVAEPFAAEARYFVESRLLNRDVNLMLEGVDKFNNFYGTVQHPAGNISAELLKVGLAKVVDWSAKFTHDAEALYKAERVAKERRLRIWKDYVAPQRSAAATNSAEFPGKVRPHSNKQHIHPSIHPSDAAKKCPSKPSSKISNACWQIGPCKQDSTCAESVSSCRSSRSSLATLWS